MGVAPATVPSRRLRSRAAMCEVFSGKPYDTCDDIVVEGQMAEDIDDQDAERPTTIGVRQRYSAWRLVRANLHDLRILLRDSFVGLAALALLLALDTLYLTRKSAPDGSSAFTPLAALYESLKLLIFQSGLGLPHDALGAALFFL